MTDKVSLTNLANLQNETTAVNAINSNNAALTTAIDNTLSRDGTSPNQMGSTLDMNSFQIINLPRPATANSALRFADLNSFVGGGTVTNIPVGGIANSSLVKTSNSDYQVGWSAIGSTEISPLDAPFNCAFDGTTNDTAGLAAALLAANGKILKFPSGKTALTDPQIIVSNWVLKLSTTSGSAVVTGLPSTTNLAVGMQVAGYTTAQKVITTLGSNVIAFDTNWSTNNIVVGMTVTGTGIPVSTTVTSIDDVANMHISNNATANGTVTCTFTNVGLASTTIKSIDSNTQITLNSNSTVTRTQVLQIGVNNVPRVIECHGSTLVARASSSLPLLTLENLPGGFTSFNLSGLRLDANNLHAQALKLRGVQFSYLRDIYLVRATAGGLWISGEPGYGVYSNLLENIECFSNTGPGIIAKTINNPGPNNQSFIAANRLVGIQALGNSSFGFDIDWAYLTLHSCRCEFNGAAGLNLNNTQGIDAFGIWLEANSSGGPDASIAATANTNGVKILGGNILGTITSSLLTLPSTFINSVNVTTPIQWINGLNFTSTGVVIPTGMGLSFGGTSASDDTINSPASGLLFATSGSSKWQYQNGIQIGSPTGGDKGNGTLNAASNLYVNNSAVLTGNQTITLSGDVTGSGTTAITAAVANIPNDVTMAGDLLVTNTAAPSSPASGKVRFWTDSTDLRLHDKNASGVVGTTVVADTGASNNFITAISAAGAISKAQPTIANLANVAGGTVLANTSGSSGAVTATIAPVLGIAGASVGSIGFNNATSGTITLQAVTGALASTVLSLPSSGGTDTLVTKASLDTLTNKTFNTAGTGNVFQINGTGITAVTGTGAVVLADSPVHTTLLTSPVIAGGSAASSTLTLESTSGAGTTDKIIFKTASQSTRATILTNGNVGIGTETNPQGPLVVSNNAATGLTSANANFNVIAPDGSYTLAYIINFANGAGTNPILGFKGAQGIGSAFTPTLSGDILGAFTAVGCSANNTFPASNTGLVQFTSEENWNSTNNGTKILFITTPKLSTGAARGTALTAWGSSGVSISTAGDPGSGNFAAPGNMLIKSATSVPAGGTAGAGYMFSSTTNLGVFFGSGAPTLSAAQGSLYVRTDGSSTSTRLYVNTNGSTTWTNVTTAT